MTMIPERDALSRILHIASGSGYHGRLQAMTDIYDLARAALTAATPSSTADEGRLVYLASPYSHADPAVMEERFEAVCRAAAQMMASGEHIYSPIAHTHPIAVRGDLPKDWTYWERYDRVMIAAADEVRVLQLPGWVESKGVNAEIEIGQEMGKRITFAQPHREPIEEQEARPNPDEVREILLALNDIGREDMEAYALARGLTIPGREQEAEQATAVGCVGDFDGARCGREASHGVHSCVPGMGPHEPESSCHPFVAPAPSPLPEGWVRPSDDEIAAMMERRPPPERGTPEHPAYWQDCAETAEQENVRLRELLEGAIDVGQQASEVVCAEQRHGIFRICEWPACKERRYRLNRARGASTETTGEAEG